MDIWPPDWDAQGAKRTMWQATQAIYNEASRPSPASQMFMLLTNRLLMTERHRMFPMPAPVAQISRRQLGIAVKQ